MKRHLSKIVRALVPGWVRAAAKERVTRRYYRLPLVASGNCVVSETGETLAASFDGVRLVVPMVAKRDVEGIVTESLAAHEVAAICAAAGKGGRLLDIGGHRGLVSGFYCAGDPTARAWCFEPSPPLAESCRTLATLNGFGGRMQVCQVALGPKPGRQTMLFDPVGGYVQVKRYEHTMWSEPQSIELVVETLDQFCAREDVAPTLVKIDVEGYEGEVLAGAGEMLRTLRPVLLVELHLAFLEDRGVGPMDVLRPLQEAGYRFSLLDGRPISLSQVCGCPLARVHFFARPKA